MDRRPEPLPGFDDGPRALVGALLPDDAERAAQLDAALAIAIERAEAAGGVGVPLATTADRAAAHVVVDLTGPTPVIAGVPLAVDPEVAAAVAARVGADHPGATVAIAGEVADAAAHLDDDGTYLVLGFHLDDPAAAWLVASYRDRRGESPDLGAALAHDAGIVAIAAIGQAGRLDRGAIATWVGVLDTSRLPLATGAVLATRPSDGPAAMPVARVKARSPGFVERVRVP
jgi:hypothetical protein